MLNRPPLWLALAGLRPADNPQWAQGPRATIAWAAKAGFRGIRLDAARPGLRPPELTRSARRDLAATFRRQELAFAGLDLWIPPEHFTRPDTCDRAYEATLAAIELAGDLARHAPGPGRVVALALPSEAPTDLIEALATAAGTASVHIADHTPDHVASPTPPEEPLRLGLDPAALLLSGHEPETLAARAAAHVVTARLSNADNATRIEPGAASGRLDEMAYLIALEAGGYQNGLVLDLRGVRAPADAAERTIQRWNRSETGPA